MILFQDMVGHKQVIEHLQNAIRMGKVSHSYIITGDVGAGKKMMATTFAATLQCENHGDSPCMKCDSCRRVVTHDHPDIIMVGHEKEGLITIDEIRRQLVNDIYIKPYMSPYKVYIVPDAQLMNIAAQNALLKTLEEPPAYAVILLLTTNIDLLLPTVRSRCVRLDMRLVDDETIKRYLMDHLHVPDYQAEVDASFGHGSVGKAVQAATSQDFQDVMQNAIRILKNVDTMHVYELTQAIKDISQDKSQMGDYLDLFQFWFRDILMYKATREIDQLVFKGEIGQIRAEANARSYENLDKVLNAIETTRTRLLANVNVEILLELLLLTIREK